MNVRIENAEDNMKCADLQLYLCEASGDEQNLPHDDAVNDDMTSVSSLVVIEMTSTWQVMAVKQSLKM